MIRKTCLAAALALGFCATTFADTPIRPGATGSGGTGAQADKNPHPDVGGEARVLRPDATSADRGDINMPESGAKRGDLKRDAAAPTGVGATGTPGGAGKAAASLPEEVRAAPK